MKRNESDKLFAWLVGHVGLMIIFIASFGDEVASMTFSFGKVDGDSMLKLSLLMTCPMLGGVLSAPVSIALLNSLQPRKVLSLILAACGVTTLIAVFSKSILMDYLACFVLGGLGTMFWAALNVLIANRFSESELPGINLVTQSIRNAGYILAPMIAGFAGQTFGGSVTLSSVSVIFFLCFPLVPSLFPGRREKSAERSTGSTAFQAPRVQEFLNLPRIPSAVLPLIMTILTTSVFNVAFIHYILVDNSMTKTDYGFIVSGISIGLVVGPLLFGLFSRKRSYDHAVVACLAASVIGLCVALSGFLSHIPSLFATLLILGVANGIQNVSMSTLTMKLIPKERRNILMPTYLLIIQVSVLSGFLVAGLIPAKYSGAVLECGGIIAMTVGMTGVALNLRLNLLAQRNDVRST